MRANLSLKSLSDDELLDRLSESTRQSRVVEVDVVALIAEVDARKLYAGEACSSMFDYCRQVLRLRENEAYLRITVARASREHPVLLTMLRDGRLYLRTSRNREAGPASDQRQSRGAAEACRRDVSPGDQGVGQGVGAAA